MSASAASTPQWGDSTRRSGSAEGACDIPAVVVFNSTQRRVKQLAPRDHDDVKAGRDLISTKHFPNQSLGSISFDRVPELAGGGDPQPADRQCVRQDEDGAVSAADAAATLVNLLNSARRRTRSRGANPATKLFAADGQPFAALRSTSLEHQTAILRAHAHEKAMRALAAPRVGLERTFPLHDPGRSFR